MRTASEVKNDVTKDIHISILKDALNDLRMANVLLKQTMWSLLVILALCIFGIVGLSLYHQHKMFHFMETSEFSSEVNMNNGTGDYNYMNVDRK